MNRRLELIEQFTAHNRVIIAMPMHNFTIPSGFKDYMDSIVKPGYTFQFTPQGSQDLLNGHKALLLQGSGSRFSSGPLAPIEHTYPFLQTLLVSMFGFDSINIICADGTMEPGIGPDAAVAKALAELDVKLPEFLA